MGEVNLNIKDKELKKVIKDFNFIPSFNRLIVTVNRVEDDKGVITTEDALAEEQYVVAAGETSKYVAGDKVLLDFEKLTVYERSQTDTTVQVPRIKITPFKFKDRIYTIIFDNAVIGKYN